MGLFKDIRCFKCNKKCNLLSRTKLKSGEYLCSDCTLRIPSFMLELLVEHYTLQDFEDFMKYVERSDKEFKPIFRETHSYHDIHIDSEHGLFYLGFINTSETIYWELHNIEEFDMIFSPGSVKEGLMGDSVKGSVLLRIKTRNPYFYYQKILTNNAKAKATKKLFSNEYQYEDPKDMMEFKMHFDIAYEKSCMSFYGEDIYNESYQQSSNKSSPDELQQAMMLFMIDDLTDISLEQLRKLRNKLIKSFHPDNENDLDNRYAQKINNAYETIKKHL